MGAMPLRYVARMVGVPALRRASRAPVSPSAATRPLTPRSYQCKCKAGYSNRDAGQKQSSQELMERLAKSDASFNASINGIIHENRMTKIERRMYMGSALIAVCLAAYTVEAVARNARAIMRKRALKREVMEQLMQAYEDEADMEGDKTE